MSDGLVSGLVENSAGLLAAHVTDAMTHSIRCVDDAGTVFYLMATTTATNRTGGA